MARACQSWAETLDPKHRGSSWTSLGLRLMAVPVHACDNGLSVRVGVQAVCIALHALFAYV